MSFGYLTYLITKCCEEDDLNMLLMLKNNYEIDYSNIITFFENNYKNYFPKLIVTLSASSKKGRKVFDYHKENIDEDTKELILLTAAEAGNIEIVKEYFQYLRDMDKFLHSVYTSGNIELINMYNHDIYDEQYARFAYASNNIELIKKFQIPDFVEDIFKCTDEEIIKNILIEREVEPNELLYYSCKNGFHQLAIKALEQGATNIDTGLMNAADNGHLNIVKLMIEQGARDYYGALSHATSTEVIKLLLKYVSLKQIDCEKYAYRILDSGNLEGARLFKEDIDPVIRLDHLYLLHGAKIIKYEELNNQIKDAMQHFLYDNLIEIITN